MCISKLFIRKDGKEELFLDEVIRIVVKEGKVIAIDLDFKQHILDRYESIEIDLMKHRVVINMGA